MNDKKKPSSFVATIDTSYAKRMIEDLKQMDFEISAPPYTVFAAKKKGVSCTLYTSGKLMVQGKEMGHFIEFYLEPQILKSFAFTYSQDLEADTSLDLTARIGIDESGKGDFFGPLCIAGVFAEKDAIKKLKEIGIRDSKTLTPAAITKLAATIRKEFIHHVVKINPPKYNELITQFGNLNRLLAWGHATVIEQLSEKTGCQRVIIDQFANEHVVLTALKRKNLHLDLTQRHKGEEDLVVAAASILARSTFVESLESLEKQFNQRLPKGASAATIEAGRAFVRSFGRDQLNLVAKLHFKTLDSIV